MREAAEQALRTLQENLPATLVIALIAGFCARKTVAHNKKGNVFLYFLLGLLGSFVGQVLLIFFDLERYPRQVPELRLLFDLSVAYVGSFILAAIVHFIKPL